MSDKEIARNLLDKRKSNESVGRLPGAGCPFMDRVGKCPCDRIFPGRKGRKTYYSMAGDCPCHKLKTAYIVRRSRAFTKEHLGDN